MLSRVTTSRILVRKNQKGIINEMSTKITTTELPLATKLYQADSKTMTGFEVVKIRGRHLVEFAFEIEDQELIDDFRSGKDGVQGYEACRRMLLRIIDTEVKKATGATEADARQSVGG